MMDESNGMAGSAADAAAGPSPVQPVPAQAASTTAAPAAPQRRRGLILAGVIVGGVVVLGGVFGGGVAVGTALDLVHFGPGMHQGQPGNGNFGGQRFGGQGFGGQGFRDGQRPGFGQNRDNGGTGQDCGSQNGQQTAPGAGDGR